MAGLHDPTGEAVAPSGEPGLLILQIDGLSTARLRRALDDGSMPFLAGLVRDGELTLTPVYSGVPSTTPAVQAELFYGVEGAVPGFSFVERATGQVMRMYQRDAAAAVEAVVAARSTGSLLDRGASYANVYTGGAANARFCMPSLVVSDFFPRHRRWLIPLVVVLHLPTLLRLTGLSLWELAKSPHDLVAALRAGEDRASEVKFAQSRVAVGVVLRELEAVGMAVDLARGLPVVHGNLLGYDENAHRRGPDSRCARVALRGIDRVIARLWKAAHRSAARAYDVWVISDHGQEVTDSYIHLHGETVATAVERVAVGLGLVAPGAVPATVVPEGGEGHQRTRVLGERVIARIVPGLDLDRLRRADDALTVTAQGPFGHVYTPQPVAGPARERFAVALVEQAHVPLVLHLGEDDGTAVAHTADGRFVLPGDAAAVLGADHPYLGLVAHDLCAVVAHPHAGDLVISGWQLGSRSVSFPFEHGAHAGPGPQETDAFALTPPDTPLAAGTTLRPRDLRDAAFALLRGERRLVPSPRRRGVRVLTYNVHSCVGLDMRIAPERIARVIARHDPDIVCLQELDVGRARTGGVDQAGEIAAALEMSLAFHPTVRVADEEFGDAVLSRHPMRTVRAGPLPGLGRRGFEPRGAIWVEVDVPDDAGGTRPVQVFNTHLSLHPRERMMAARALLGTEWLGHPDAARDAVLCGDFNALAWFPTMRRLRDRLADAQTGLDGHRPRRTWSGRFPIGRIDHVLIDPTWRVLHVEVADHALATVASDHRPVIVDVAVDGGDLT